uniref:Uncharacterized protein n=1 Tax=viral metagenome TaxID=1070528 RepID=A0A6M3J2S5_9ZZZZ
MTPLARATLATLILAQAAGLLKAELTLRLASWIADPWWCRAAAYGLAIVLTLIVAPANAWLAWRLQR